MANIVTMPQLGISEESAVLTSWHVAAGDKVSRGDKLFSIETGKSAFDVESEFSGEVLGLLAQEGDEVLIKKPVCAIGEHGEVFEAPQEISEVPAEAPSAAVQAVETAFHDEAPRSAVATGVSPRARNLAAKAGVDPRLAVPTGPDGRIIERDVRLVIDNPDAAAQRSAPSVGIIGGADGPTAIFTAPAVQKDGGYQDKPLSTIRKVIAKNMSASLQNAAQLTHTASFDATNIMDYRKLLKADSDPVISGITLTDMVMYAVTRTLPSCPELNAWYMGDSMRYFDEVNLACAVDTGRGLMVPVLFGASEASLSQLSVLLKKLASLCREGSVPPELLTGGSFTVSNLGVYGIESFTPILNTPQTGILGVNTITQRVREKDGVISVYPCMSLSLTYDHRALDGAPASRFLQTLCRNLESFTTLLVR